MIISNLASRILRPFAAAGSKATIPIKQTDATRASYEQGFPALNMTPIAAGGVPPSGQDFNGILYDISNAAMWQQAAGILPWSAEFAQSPISSGYPKNALVVHNAVLYQSAVDNNSSTPGGGVDWRGVSVASATQPQHAVTQKQLKDGLAQHTHPDATQSASGFMSVSDKLALDRLVTTALPEAAPAGAVAFFASANAPAGWLAANGAAVSRTAYARLWEVMGTMFGVGDGSTTFNLPDLRGVFLRGLDGGRGMDGGRAIGTHQEDAMQAWTSEITYQRAQINGSETIAGATAIVRSGTGSATTGNGWTVAHVRMGPGVNNVARTAAETRPKNVALLPCIKY